MKPLVTSTIILVTNTRIARVDLSAATPFCEAVSRPAGASFAQAVRAALALGAKPGSVWILSDDVFAQRVSLSAGQIAGLTSEQLGRALSFEVEPFSGIAVVESALGYHRGDGEAFDVVEITQTVRDEIQRAVQESGGKLVGIAHARAVPEDSELASWFADVLAKLQRAELPSISPAAPAPPANRYLVTGFALEAAAILILLCLLAAMGYRLSRLERLDAELSRASRELAAATKRNTELQTELTALDKEQAQRERVETRRGALGELLHGIASTRGEDVVVRSIVAEGPSNLIVSGLSLEADAVDEMSIVLTQRLRTSGWTAQSRSKTGKRNLPSGGPWEFSLSITHQEASAADSIQLSQRGME